MAGSEGEDVEAAGSASGQPCGNHACRRRDQHQDDDLDDGDGESGGERCRKCCDHAGAEQQAEPDPEGGAARGNQCRFEANHSTELAASHADRSNQAELRHDVARRPDDLGVQDSAR